MNLQNEKCVMVIDEKPAAWHYCEYGGYHGHYARKADAGGCRYRRV